ncbi:MAG: hypothetical protein BGP24_17515 [Lysobacterales bacterium 69-70]|nr:hypothetical protein [Xanthomonadaceae bacterium]ODU32526.1 MAG: hypothetical protein ABS97_15400 [Xanthomonadaceae bacterium SCN 69-320]ODV19312.1 MAG: hypothetical protein ABT27_11190 [Xanthomonadaceae bacterium SCN 69-25]OJZ00371.1 MAG: hypothetical protein BGP24_17515 [Xanthomonadales bacterium 69-70]
MSYSTHRKQSLNVELPIRHRLSHVRSCAVHVSQKYRVSRSVVLDLLGIADAYEERDLPSSLQIGKAIEALDEIKACGLPTDRQAGDT